MTVQRGLIVIGDVSGYSEFIATTELKHSREILAELLGTLCGCAPGGLSIAQLEGDAVFWLCDGEAPGLVDVLKEKFVEFHRRLRFMTLATTCPCQACASVGSLTLKFVVRIRPETSASAGETAPWLISAAQQMSRTYAVA